MAKLHSVGIRSTIYIDDGRILARSEKQMDVFREKAYTILRQSGWQLELHKSDGKGDSSRTKQYLGFILNTHNMKVFATQEKLTSIRSLIQEHEESHIMEVKNLAKIMGKLISLRHSHGKLAQIATRSGYLCIEQHTQHYGWKGKLRISKSCKRELKFFMNNLQKYNGTPMDSKLNSVRLEQIFKNPKAKNPELEIENLMPNCNKIVSDSSEFRAAVINLERAQADTGNLTFQFDEEEKKRSSGFRELLAVRKSVQHWRATNSMSNRKIYWATDSTNVVSFLTKGSSKPHVQDIVFEIITNLAIFESKIVPIHLLWIDERIQEADKQSKTPDSDDWSIDNITFNSLQSRYNLKIDIFANKNNRRLEK